MLAVTAAWKKYGSASMPDGNMEVFSRGRGVNHTEQLLRIDCREEARGISILKAVGM
jgi:hypothetical protein